MGQESTSTFNQRKLIDRWKQYEQEEDKSMADNIISITLIKNMSEYTNLVLTRIILHKYAQLSQLTS